MTDDQSHFDFLVPVTKELLRVDEVITILRQQKDTVYALVDEGKLEAHQNDKRSAHYRITRRSVIAHLASTATYRPDDFIHTLESLIKRLPRHQRQALVKKFLQS